MLIEPPTPPLDTPDNNDTQPLLPALDVPVLRSTDPVTPRDRASADASITEPDPELRLDPDRMSTGPPAKVAPSVTPADRTSEPPLNALEDVPEPTVMLMEPPLPPLATPDCRAMKPLFPDLEVPVLSNNDPVRPTDNALADEITTLPELDDKLDPDVTTTAPPSWTAAVEAPPSMLTTPPTTPRPAPAINARLPPITELALPTTILMEPPRPPVAEPDCKDNHPLLPDADVPVLRRIVPVTLRDRALAVETTMLPEPELKLVPL